MVNPEQFKRKIEELVAQDHKVEFLGKNFNYIVNSLTDTKVEKIYKWVEDVVNRTIQPILVGSKKPYKEWRIH